MNLVETYQKTTEVQKVRGEFWYSQARLSCISLAVKYNLCSEKVISVVSHLSPRVRWEQNLKDAELVIQSFNLGKPIESIRARAYKRNVAKAYQVLMGSSPAFGQKTQSFYNCIADPKSNDVCIDVWAARAVGYKSARIKPADYKEIQKQYWRASDKLGLQPCSLQATIWLDIREKYVLRRDRE